MTFLRRLSCAVGKTAQKVVRRVLSRAPKERVATVRRRFLLCGLFICGKFSPRAFILRPLKRRRATGQGVVCNAAKCALGADCRRAWQRRAKMPLVCLAGQVLFFAFFDLYECGSIIFPMRMACFVDERNGQAPCATVGQTVQKVVRRVLPREPKACSTRGKSKRDAVYCSCRECFFEG